LAAKTSGNKFQGLNVQECLSLASFSLGVPVEKIKYSILEEKNGLFKKHAVICVDEIEGLEDEENSHTKDDIKDSFVDEKNGIIEVSQGKILIKNPKEGGKPATIASNDNITITVNGENLRRNTPLFEDSVILVVYNEEMAKRQINLKTSVDKMEAYISIIYKSNIIYKLKDTSPKNSLILELDVKEEIMPPKFTELEIKNELGKNNIIYGILKMNIIKCATCDEVSGMLIASGKKPVYEIDDKLNIKFDEAVKKNNQQDDDAEIIDYKSIDYKAIGAVKGVETGQVLAVLTPGKNGEDGVDIFGKIIKVKTAKKILIGIGEGCKLLDEFTVVATSEGRPSVRVSTFYVYKTHEINGDVELKTGNIKFVGDIIISGSVREGMKVEAGNSILIRNNVAESEIVASGDVVIKGNVIHSNVAAGKEDVLILDYLNDLNSMKNDVSKLTSSIRQLKELNLLERNTSDGELIKILLESKFKKIPETAIRVAKRILTQEAEQDELVYIIKNKILNLGPLNIKNFEELNDVVTFIENKIAILSMKLTLPVNVVMDYCQDSIIKSSGNITFTGKGQYVSQIEASGSVIFQNEKSVARGGFIKAGKEIKCKIVGGMGGVSTKLIVENHGNIWAEVAYPNTRFIIGAREYILDVASKKVHAFIDESRELVVDKLLL